MKFFMMSFATSADADAEGDDKYDAETAIDRMLQSRDLFLEIRAAIDAFVASEVSISGASDTKEGETKAINELTEHLCGTLTEHKLEQETMWNPDGILRPTRLWKAEALENNFSEFLREHMTSMWLVFWEYQV